MLEEPLQIFAGTNGAAKQLGQPPGESVIRSWSTIRADCLVALNIKR